MRDQMYKLTAEIQTRTKTWTEIHNGTAEGIQMVKDTIRRETAPGSTILFKVENSDDSRFY